MIGLNIHDTSTARVAVIHGQLAPGSRRGFMNVLGRQLEGDVRRHFTARDQEGNKKGWPRQHFWSREGRKKTALAGATDDTATVNIASAPIAHKVEGGTIRPGPGRKFLAIPVRGEVYGKLARSEPVPGLFPFTARGKSWLASTIAEGPGGPLRVFYRLLRSVTHAPDPDALPDAADLSASVLKRALALLERKRAQQGGAQ